MEKHSESLETVMTASLIHEIHIAKSLLNDNGIDSYIFDENIMSTLGTAYVQGYKLKVSNLDLEKAQEILSQLEGDNN